jgi:hypothetical protein
MQNPKKQPRITSKKSIKSKKVFVDVIFSGSAKS